MPFRLAEEVLNLMVIVATAYLIGYLNQRLLAEQMEILARSWPTVCCVPSRCAATWTGLSVCPRPGQGRPGGPGSGCKGRTRAVGDADRSHRQGLQKRVR